jgi:AcrR family transcriptional regulator
MPKVIDNVKNAIINETVKIIKEEGYKKFNIRHIASRCNIAMGTVYNYYSSKEDIINEILHIKATEILESISKKIKEKTTQYDKAACVFNILQEFFLTVEEEFLRDFASAIWSNTLKNNNFKEMRENIKKYSEESQKSLMNIIKEELSIENVFEAEVVTKLFLMYAQKEDFEFKKLWDFINKNIYGYKCGGKDD